MAKLVEKKKAEAEDEDEFDLEEEPGDETPES